MKKTKYYYATLSCPSKNDSGSFLYLLENLEKKELFTFTLQNIPFNLKSASQNDFIFIHVGGDDNKKRKYFNESEKIEDYENGIHSIGIIYEIRALEKEVDVQLIGLESVITKKDLYFFPQFINNLGASTKGAPNQAGLYELKEDVGLGLIDLLVEQNAVSSQLQFLHNLDYKNKLFSTAFNEYKNSFKQKELNSRIFRKYNETNPIQNPQSRRSVIRHFIKWLNLEDNFRLSYKGIVNKENLEFWDSTYFNNMLFHIVGTDKEAILKQKRILLNKHNPKWKLFNESSSKGAPKAILGDKNYLKFLDLYLDNNFLTNEVSDSLSIGQFEGDINSLGLFYSDQLIQRYVSSLLTKPFVLLTGLSGSGKTKLAQAFAMWICESEEQYKIVPVGADWTNREPLLGYVNAIEANKYVSPENGALNLIIEASKEENEHKPYFLILDEMNLSHVERYFADFLSVMESNDKFRLHDGMKALENQNGEEIASAYSWPVNFFVVGTVNIDETTYMFSPKVLDRANTIEFRVTATEIEEFLKEKKKLDLGSLKAEGAKFAKSFIEKSTEGKESILDTTRQEDLVSYFEELQVVGAEFGYRTANEISVLFYHLKTFGVEDTDAMDIAIMQKLLPKLHGSRRKLVPVLQTLANLCLSNHLSDKKDILSVNDKVDPDLVNYKISMEKLWRMHKNVIENGFTSYAEA